MLGFDSAPFSLLALLAIKSNIEETDKCKI